MNHVRRRQPESRRDARFAGRAADTRRDLRNRAARGQELGPGRAVDRAVDAAPAEQRLVRGVDDRIERERRDVRLNDFDRNNALIL
jgi:hypothetical protein